MKKFNLTQKIYLLLTFVLYSLFLVLSVLSLFTNTQHIEWLVQCIICILIITLPLILEKYTKLEFSFLFYLFLSIFIFLTIFLGYTLKFYKTVPYYDTLAHTLSGILILLFGIMTTYKMLKLNENSNIFAIAFLGIIFTLACGLIWEIVEFLIDTISNSNMQRFIPEIENLYNGGNSSLPLNGNETQISEFYKNPSGYKFALLDTMYDLICDLIGAILGSIFFILLNKKNKNSVYNLIKIKKEINEVTNIEKQENNR